MRLLITNLTLTICAFLSGALAYFIMSSVFGHVFGGLFRMFMYHEEHPYQYIAIVAITFGITGSFWVVKFSNATGKSRTLSICITLVSTIIIASIPGGILWKLHDMQAGYYPEGLRFWKDLASGAISGITLGWLVMLISIPYNLIGFVAGYTILNKLPSTMKPNKMQNKAQ